MNNHSFIDYIPTHKIIAKSVNLRYIYDIAAIPENIRKEYLLKLSKRINSQEQKNVRLLRIIYGYLEEGRKILWDDELICRKLDISKNMLYAYKSRLLKGLREMYFGWKEIEKNEFSSKNADNIEMNFKKAKRMDNIGMKKEARNIFLDINKKLSYKKKRTNKEDLILFNSIERLCHVTSVKQNFRKFNIFVKKLEQLGRIIIKKNKKVKSYIMMKLYFNRAIKMLHKTSNVTKALELLDITLKKAKKNNDKKLELSIIYNQSHLSYMTEKYDSWNYHIREGLRITSKKPFSDEHIAFKISALVMNAKKKSLKYDQVEKEAHYYLDYLKKLPYNSIWIIRSLYNLTLLSYSNLDTPVKILYEYNSRKIISEGLNTNNLQNLYYMKFYHYLTNAPEPEIQTVQKATKKPIQFIINKTTNKIFIRKLDNAILELTISLPNLKNIIFRKELFRFMLFSDFYKGSKCSYTYSAHIKKQIDYINITRPEIKNLNKKFIDFLFLGISMMSEYSQLNKKDFLHKYEMKFRQFADSLLKTEFYLIDYYLLSFIAEQCNDEDLKQIVQETFFKFEAKYPELIKIELEKIKKSDRNNIIQNSMAA